MNGVAESYPCQRGQDVFLHLTWGITYVGAAATLKFVELHAALQALVVAVPLAIAAIAMQRYWQRLKRSDELQQMLEVRSLAITLGATIVLIMLLALAPLADEVRQSRTHLVLAATMFTWIGVRAWLGKQYR